MCRGWRQSEGEPPELVRGTRYATTAMRRSRRVKVRYVAEDESQAARRDRDHERRGACNVTALAEGTERSAAVWTRNAIVVTYRGMEEEAARLNALSQGRPRF